MIEDWVTWFTLAMVVVATVIAATAIALTVTTKNTTLAADADGTAEVPNLQIGSGTKTASVRVDGSGNLVLDSSGGEIQLEKALFVQGLEVTKTSLELLNKINQDLSITGDPSFAALNVGSARLWSVGNVLNVLADDIRLNGIASTSRYDSWLSGKTSSDLAEGNNLYYTSARFQIDFSQMTTDQLQESKTPENLYYTQARFNASLGDVTLSNFTALQNQVIAAARSSISAGGNNLLYNSSTGEVSTKTSMNIPTLTVNDLIVTGTQTVASTLAVATTYIELASGNVSAATPIGLYNSYVDGSTKYCGLFRSVGNWYLFENETQNPTGGFLVPSEVNRANLFVNVLNSASVVCSGTISGLSVSGSWTGSTIGVGKGGTGLTGLTAGEMLWANSGSTLQAVTRNATAEKLFLTQSSSGMPAWLQVKLSDVKSDSSYTPGQVLTTDGSSALTMLTGNPLTTKKYLTSSGNAVTPAAPEWTQVAATELTGTTLASNVLNSSLTSVGTLTALAVTGNATIGGRVSDKSGFVMPVGTVIAWCGSITAEMKSAAVSGGLPVQPVTGWLLCDGTLLTRTSYADLFAIIGTTFGSFNGSTFYLPDMRGKFLRCTDQASGNDPDRASRANAGGAAADASGWQVGTKQGDGMRQHDHQVWAAAGNSANEEQDWLSWYGNSRSQYDRYDKRTQGMLNPNTNDTFSYAANETRPANVYVHYIIKY